MRPVWPSLLGITAFVVVFWLAFAYVMVEVV